MKRIQEKMEIMIDEQPNINEDTVNEVVAPVQVDEDQIDHHRSLPDYFKPATITSVDKEKSMIHLDIPAEVTPTAQYGDGCATNMKAARCVKSEIGLASPFPRCSSHNTEAVVYVRNCV